MDFQKYINHHTHRSSQNEVSSKKSIQQKPRVIKFVGNMEDNIKQLLQHINCHCGNKKQFFNIMMVFANKIEKLRKQREHYKDTLKDYLLTLNNQKHPLIQEFKTLQEKEKGPEIKHQNAKKSRKQNELFYKTQTVQKRQNKKDQNLQKLNLNIQQKPSVEIKRQKNSSKHLQTQQMNQQCKNKQSMEGRNNYTTVKKPLYQQIYPFEQTCSQDKRMKHSSMGQIKNNKIFDQDADGQIQFSLNLSEFQECDQQTTQFIKQVSSIMSQTNLLQSDEEEPDQEPVVHSKKQSKLSQLEDKINKLKILKQSSNFTNPNLLKSNGPSLGCQLAFDEVKKSARNQKRQNPQEGFNLKSSFKKTVPNDKQNIKGAGCLKKYNISLQKLEQFIENKECLRQLQKTQQFQSNLKNFKSISCSLKKDNGEFTVKKRSYPMKALEQRKINFNY